MPERNTMKKIQELQQVKGDAYDYYIAGNEDTDLFDCKTPFCPVPVSFAFCHKSFPPDFGGTVHNKHCPNRRVTDTISKFVRLLLFNC